MTRTTLRSVEEEIIAEWQRTEMQVTTSQSYRTGCVERLVASEFVIWLAQRLE
jgi:hypothetical protein